MTTTIIDSDGDTTTSAGIVEPESYTRSERGFITAITPGASKRYSNTTKGRNAAARWLAARGYGPDGTRLPDCPELDGGSVPEAAPKPATPTREAFLAAYRERLASLGWAAEPEKLERFMAIVGKALRGDPSGNWSPTGQEHAAAAWKAIGGKGKPTMKALKALPSGEPAPEVCLAIVRLDAIGVDDGPGVIVKSPATYQDWQAASADNAHLIFRSNREYRLPTGARVIVPSLDAGAAAIRPEPGPIERGRCVRLAAFGDRNATIGVVRSLVLVEDTARALVAWPDSTEQYVDVEKLRAVFEYPAPEEAPAPEVAPPAPTGIFAFTSNPKILAALRMRVRYGDDGEVLPRHEFIERQVAAGWRVIEREVWDAEGKATIARRFMLPAGDVFFDERDMTKSGLDYATWLIDKLPADEQAPEVEVEVAPVASGWDATIDEQRELGNAGAGIAGRTFTPVAAPPDAAEARALGEEALARANAAVNATATARIEQLCAPPPGFLSRAIDDSRIAAFEREPGNGPIAAPAATALASATTALESIEAQLGGQALAKQMINYQSPPEDDLEVAGPVIDLMESLRQALRKVGASDSACDGQECKMPALREELPVPEVAAAPAADATPAPIPAEQVPPVEPGVSDNFCMIDGEVCRREPDGTATPLTVRGWPRPAVARAHRILEGLSAFARNQLAAGGIGTAFTSYEAEGDEVCRELVLQAQAWSRANYDAHGVWCGEGTPPQGAELPVAEVAPAPAPEAPPAPATRTTVTRVSDHLLFVTVGDERRPAMTAAQMIAKWGVDGPCAGGIDPSDPPATPEEIAEIMRPDPELAPAAHTFGEDSPACTSCHGEPGVDVGASCPAPDPRTAREVLAEADAWVASERAALAAASLKLPEVPEPSAEAVAAELELVLAAAERAGGPEMRDIFARTTVGAAMAKGNARLRAQAAALATRLSAVTPGATDQETRSRVAEAARYGDWKARMLELAPDIEATGRTRNAASGLVAINVSLAGAECPSSLEERHEQARIIERALAARETAWKLYLELNKQPAFRAMVRRAEASLAEAGIPIGSLDQAEGEASSDVNTASSEARTG